MLVSEQAFNNMEAQSDAIFAFDCLQENCKALVEAAKKGYKNVWEEQQGFVLYGVQKVLNNDRLFIFHLSKDEYEFVKEIEHFANGRMSVDEFEPILEQFSTNKHNFENQLDMLALFGE